MKQLMSIVLGVVIVTLLTAALYILGLPPFNVGGALGPMQTQETMQGVAEEIPDVLAQDQKVGRNKSYQEYMNHGASMETNGYHSLAIAEYTAASKLGPGKVEPLIEIGRIYLREHDFINAKLVFQKALEINPDDTTTKIYLTRALLGDRKITDAQKVMNSVVIHDSQSKYYQGILAAYFGEEEKAKSLLNEAINIGGNADTISKAQNFLNAYAEFHFNQGGNNVHLKTLLGRSFNQVGEYQMAIPLLFDVLKEKKNYRDPWILLGFAYLNVEKYQDAVEALEQAKKLDSLKAETHFYLGLGYFGLNDLQNAANELELAKKYGYEPVIQIDQKLAEIYLQLKEYPKSAMSFENVLALNSTDVNYFIKPMWIYMERLNSPEKALALAKKAQQANPKLAMSYNLLGWASIGTNHLDDAEGYLKKALAIDPNLDAIYLNYGLLSEKRGRLTEAVSYYRKAYTMGNGNSISSSAADHYNQLIQSIDQSNTTLKASLLSGSTP
ncbi:tetratricopeptide repeat protein [Candidatus Peregrinibacteria bacterium]|nr:tetratricopeptide repeat protein [Candidatus Peregrinibacteria bacterium]